MLTAGFRLAPAANSAVLAALTLWSAAALLVRWHRVRGTTLVTVWYWSLAALLAIALSGFLIGSDANAPPANWALSLRFAAAMGTFCPIMAMLGAKRPQDRAWQFIVLSLWVILSLPAGEWLLFNGAREIHPARYWFLIVLVGVGALNGLATRGWLSSLLYGLGQLTLIATLAPGAQTWPAGDVAPLVALSLLASAWTLAALPIRRSPDLAGLDRLWLDFRDAFGVVWALRVAERFNASVAKYNWPVTLHWHGFLPHDPQADVVVMPAAVEQNLRGLLRRFVSAAWIDERLAGAAGQDTLPVDVPLQK